MTDLNQVAVLAGQGGDERGAELVLARLADARVMLAASPAVKVTAIAAEVSLVISGVWLRGHVPARWPAVAVACLAAAAAALAFPALSVLAGRREPKWARAAAVHRQSLPGRVPAAALAVADRCLARLARLHWRGVHLYVSRCTDPSPAHAGVCQSAGVFPLHGRVLVVIGEHLAAGPPEITAAVLGHESLHVTGWRLRLSLLGKAAGLAGWVIIGWAVPWPVLLPAALALRAAVTALSWAVEISCDLGSASTHGTPAMTAALARISQAAAAARAAAPAGKRHAASILTWITGPPHPPLPARRALISALAPRQPRPSRPDLTT